MLLAQVGVGKRTLKKCHSREIKIGTLVRYRYPNYDLGVVMDVKISRKKDKEPLYLIRWPETGETLWMSGILLEIVSK